MKASTFLVNLFQKYYWKKVRGIMVRLQDYEKIEEFATLHNKLCKEIYLRQGIKGLYDKTTKEEFIGQGKPELYLIFSLIQKSKHLNGEIAEIGVYKGGTGKMMAEMGTGKEIHLFDTFEGFPYTSGGFKKGDMNVSFEEVKSHFTEYNNVFFHKGEFPQTAASVVAKTFSFIHFDVDVYKPTLEGLKFFYPRMAKGGFMVFHDYRTLPDIKKATEEFFSDKPEVVLETFGNQGVVQVLGK